MFLQVILSFVSGLVIGAVIGGLRLRAKLKVYKFFVEERLSRVVLKTPTDSWVQDPGQERISVSKAIE